MAPAPPTKLIPSSAILPTAIIPGVGRVLRDRFKIKRPATAPPPEVSKPKRVRKAPAALGARPAAAPRKRKKRQGEFGKRKRRPKKKGSDPEPEPEPEPSVGNDRASPSGLRWIPDLHAGNSQGDVLEPESEPELELELELESDERKEEEAGYSTGIKVAAVRVVDPRATAPPRTAPLRTAAEVEAVLAVARVESKTNERRVSSSSRGGRSRSSSYRAIN